ncbi:MAG: cell division septation protein DedD [Arenicella sp.]|jgi:cell division septation protein DedD
MPSKPDSKASTQTGEVDFVLKHRIVGAGFLLFFGALVLPWLLGPPSEAFKLSNGLSSDAKQIRSVVDKTGQLAVEQINPAPEQDQIYISKITPLDGGADAKSSSPANEPSKNLPARDKSASIDTPKDSQATQRKTDNKTSSSEKPKESSTKSADGSSKSADGSSESAEDSLKPSVVKRDPVSAKAASPAPSMPKVDVGWVVQVGVFTDKRGAAKVVDDLRGKGFTPSTSIVDTNRGKATGTRIWLGPYAQRVEAAKAKSQLTSKTGEAGFIRAYP